MDIKTMRTESEVMLVWSSCGFVNGGLHMHLLLEMYVKVMYKNLAKIVSDAATGV